MFFVLCNFVEISFEFSFEIFVGCDENDDNISICVVATVGTILDISFPFPFDKCISSSVGAGERASLRLCFIILPIINLIRVLYIYIYIIFTANRFANSRIHQAHRENASILLLLYEAFIYEDIILICRYIYYLLKIIFGEDIEFENVLFLKYVTEILGVIELDPESCVFLKKKVSLLCHWRL